MWGHGLDQAGSGYGQVAGTCDCGDDPFGSIKCREYLDYQKPVGFLRRTLLYGVNM